MDDLVVFAQQFISTARDHAFEYPAINKAIFSSRQSLAITSLGTAKILRTNGPLAPTDLIYLSIVTSPPEAQKYAEYIALKILYGNLPDIEKEEVKTEVDHEDEKEVEIIADLTGVQLMLSDILNFLNLEKSVDTSTDEKIMEFIEYAESDLYSKSREDNNKLSDHERLELARKRLAFELIGGREGLITHNISNWEELFKVAKFLLLQSIPEIQNYELTYAQVLGHSDEISNLTFEKYVEVMSNILLASELHTKDEIKGELDDVLNLFSHHQFLKGYQLVREYRGLLQRTNVSEKFYAPLLDHIIKQFEQYIISKATNMGDFLSEPQLFTNYEFNEDKLESILDEDERESVDSKLKQIQQAEEFDRLFDTNISDRLMSRFDKDEQKFSFEELMDNHSNSPNWMELLEKGLEEKLKNLSNYHDHEQLIDDLNEMTDGDSNYSNDFYKKKIRDLASKMTEIAKNYDQLEGILEKMRSMNMNPNYSKAKKRGEQLGLSPNEIARLMGNYFEYFKDLISDKNEDPSYERSEELLKRINPNGSQFKTLTRQSFKFQCDGALGALAMRDLNQVVSQMPDGDDAEELLSKALGAGGGENLLMEWFKSGRRLPAKARKIVKDAARRVMIDLAKAKSAALIGSSEAGPLPEGSIRPFIQGDDLDTVDIEESLDNILASGKHLNDVVAEDFIVRKTVSGRRCVVFLIDISGSMQGAPLACASLAAAMLLMAFSRDELALALFESNTHILCSINEEIEVDEVVNEVLELHARGGTQMSAAVKWAEDQFLLSTSSDKMFIMVTDAMIGDFEASAAHIEAIGEMGATSIMILPHDSYGLGNIQSTLDRANTQLITIDDWRRFPELVSEVLSRT